MIALGEYRNYWRSFTSFAKIDSVCMVISEKHLTKKLPDHNGRVLAVVYPSYDSLSGGDLDNDGKEAICILFYLEKINPGNQGNEQDEIDAYESLQLQLIAVEEKIKDDYRKGFNIFTKVQLIENSIHYDPEYQVFGGYNGWSMSFKLTHYATE